MAEVVIAPAGTERVGELEPLWSAMHAHHATLQEQLAPVRDRAESWRRRREQYERWLAEDAAQLLIAERDGTAVGYAVLSVGPGPPTWDVGERVAELESLAVLEQERGSGVGAQLLAAAREAASARGAQRMCVGVAHANAGALRFYEREGFAPFYSLLLDGGGGRTVRVEDDAREPS